MTERTYACKHCWDSGIRTVIGLEVVKAIREDRQRFIANGCIYTAMAKCNCPSGERRFGQAIPLYHSGMVDIPVVCRGTPEEQRQAYVEEVDAHAGPRDFSEQFT